MSTDSPSDDPALPFIRMVVAANDLDHLLWSPENQMFASQVLQKTNGHIPSLKDIYDAVGNDRYEYLLDFIVKKRKFDNICLGYRSPCHHCGSLDGLSKADFGLMKVSGSSRNWSQTATSLGLSAALFPLLGGIMLTLPGKNLEGAILHLRLIVCESCRKKHSGMFGTFFIAKRHAEKHPLWQELIAAGFEKFLVRDTLPMELRARVHMRL